MRYSLAFAGLAAAQVSSIVDGQPQAATSAMGALTSIVDGQPQAPATAMPAAVSSIVDGQPQAPTTAPGPVAQAPQTVTTYATHLTTYCPEAGVKTYGSQTFTVTKPTTLTVLDCSCTLTNTIPAATMAPAAAKPTMAPAAPAAAAPAAPAAPAVYSNGTTMATSAKSPLTSTVFVSTCPGCPATVPVVMGPTQAPAAGVNGSSPAMATGAMTAAPAKFTGAASKVSGAGAGLAAVFGLAAYLL